MGGTHTQINRNENPLLHWRLTTSSCLKRGSTLFARHTVCLLPSFLLNYNLSPPKNDNPEPAQPPQLVILLHEFEQFDPAVIQDLFYICRCACIPSSRNCLVKNILISLHIPRLPLIFILSLSSPPVPPPAPSLSSSSTPAPPPTPTYLNLTYPRTTLALLRVQNFTVPSGLDVLDIILTKVRVLAFEADGR